LDKNLKSFEDYMIRKLVWAKDNYIEERSTPTLLKLESRAVIKNKTSNESEKVQRAIYSTLQEIESAVESK
jgi:hypothetical protein